MPRISLMNNLSEEKAKKMYDNLGLCFECGRKITNPDCCKAVKKEAEELAQDAKLYGEELKEIRLIETDHIGLQ